MDSVPIDLICITIQNSAGVITELEASTRVFASKKSIRQSEFYQAQTTGFRPEIMFVMRSIDYSGESRIEYNSRTYNIRRTFDKGEFVELICQGIGEVV